MANSLKDLSASLREAIQRASAYTVGIEHRPYTVSGVLIGAERVLTASHLVSDEGIGIVLPDGRKAEAKVAGRDPAHDLALLRLGSSFKADRPPVGAVAVGDLVVSLRRDPFDGINASLAMISAAGSKLRLGRMAVIERYVQTDAARLPGSTGGPLVDAEGALAGIQVFNRRMGSEVAIPVDLALERAKVLEEKGSIRRPYLGIRSQAVTLPASVREALKGRQETGLLLVVVEQGSAAERGGLEVGDMLVGFAGSQVTEHEELVSLMTERGADAAVEVEIVRGGAPRKVNISLGGA